MKKNISTTSKENLGGLILKAKKQNLQSLSELYHAHRGKVSDKWNFYLGMYDNWFDEVRQKRVSIFEIGIQNGGSLEIWRKYFRNAKFIVGCDINAKCKDLRFRNKAISVVVGDANSDTTEQLVVNICPAFDIIIDDGSHKSSDIVRSFSRYFKYLNHDGFYIIEDLHCSYWEEFEGGLYAPYTAMAFFKQLADVLSYEHWGLGTGRIDLIQPILEQYGCSIDESLLKQIHTIEFSNSLCLIRKAKTSNSLEERIVVGDEQSIFPIKHLSGTRSTSPSEANNRWNVSGLPPQVQFFQLSPVVNTLNSTISRLNAERSALVSELTKLSHDLMASREKNHELNQKTLLGESELVKSNGMLPQIIKYLSHLAKVFSRAESNLLKEDFDEVFYLKNNPDVAKAGIDPLQHYKDYGKKEGRLGRLRRLTLSILTGMRSFDESKETILLAVHEASLTGAPVLGYNLVRLLSQKYNVITVSLSGGPLNDSFVKYSLEYITPAEGSISHFHEDVLAKGLLLPLIQRFHIKALLANSAETEALVSAARNINLPVVTLVHEFSEYVLPARMLRIVKNSDVLVFSSKLTMESARNLNPSGYDLHTFIMPQGRSEIPQTNSETLGSEYLKLLLSRNNHARFICIGCGLVQMRKGVDLFIAMAAAVTKVLGPEAVQFIWIGDGYDPERDFAYSVWLKDQIARSGVGSVMAFVPSVGSEDLKIAYQSADCLFLSSRLDPFPNVGIDAICEELPVVCFRGASGIAQYLDESDGCKELVVPYLDVDSASKVIIQLALDSEFSQQIKLSLRSISKHFDMSSYILEVEKLIDLSLEINQRRLADAKIIANECILDHSVLRFPLINQAGELDYALKYVRMCENDYSDSSRRPFLGFSPQIYDEKCLPKHTLPKRNALAHWVESGKPQGPWLRKILTIRNQTDLSATNKASNVAIHLHIHYTDMAEEILTRIMSNRSRPQLLVSTTSIESARELANLFSRYDGPNTEILLVENRGRDIGPFLCQFSQRLREFDIIGHFHTKKSIELGNALGGQIEEWREFILASLLGGNYNCMDQILNAMQNDDKIGLVFPEDPNLVGWTKNRHYAENLVDRLQLASLTSGIEFPVGNMFFARSRALAAMFQANFQLNEFPDEPVAYDGTILHAIERLTPLVTEAAGFDTVTVHSEGVLR